MMYLVVIQSVVRHGWVVLRLTATLARSAGLRSFLTSRDRLAAPVT